MSTANTPGWGCCCGVVAPLAGRIPAELPIPHMGWNALSIVRPGGILKYVSQGECVYFVHSYAAWGCEDSLCATAEYGAPSRRPCRGGTYTAASSTRRRARARAGHTAGLLRTGGRAMLIYPAIDLYEGKAVRLYRGDYARMTVYSAHPVEVARDFARQGATHMHVVDLEGARGRLDAQPGHGAGDSALQRAVRGVRRRLRSLEAVEAVLSAGRGPGHTGHGGRGGRAAAGDGGARVRQPPGRGRGPAADASWPVRRLDGDQLPHGGGVHAAHSGPGHWHRDMHGHQPRRCHERGEHRALPAALPGLRRGPDWPPAACPPWRTCARCARWGCTGP